MIVIVGAGLSGLYLGHLLRRLGRDFVILEKNDKVGGRVDDRRWRRRVLAAGAGIFHANQKHMTYLMDAFGVERASTRGRQTFYDFSDLPTAEAEAAGAGEAGELPPLRPVRGDRRVRDVVPEAYRRYDPAFDECADMNYNDWLASRRGTGEVFVARLGDLVAALRRELRGHIRTGCTVTAVRQPRREPGSVAVRCKGGELELSFEACVLTCSRKESARIRFEGAELDARVRLAQSLTRTCASLRVYTWSRRLHGLEHDYFVSDKPYRFAIKVDDHVLMASYTDERRARALMRLPEAELREQLEDQLGVQVDDMVVYPCRDAYTILDYTASNRLLNGIHKLTEGVYQTFVPHRLDQAWAESHLVQAAKVAAALGGQSRGRPVSRARRTAS